MISAPCYLLNQLNLISKLKGMSHFTKDYFDFFKELAANNSKDWFDVNRDQYKKSVKEPFDQFVSDVITEVRKLDPKVEITYKEAVFRINRDIRFSKDKTPYKLNRSAIISPKGRKDKAFPGLYIELSPEHFRVYGGVYMPDKDQLYNIREAIVKNPKALQKLTSDKKFISTFSEVRGEKNKIIAKEFKEAGAKFDLIYNKQWYWFTDLPLKKALDKDVVMAVIEAYKVNKPIMDYFSKAMQ